MPHRPTQKIFPLNGVMRRGVFATLLATTPMLPSLSWAEEASVSQVRQYSIGAGNLDQVLNRFASQAGILLSVDAQLTSGKRSTGLQGRFDVARGLEGVQRLLETATHVIVFMLHKPLALFGRCLARAGIDRLLPRVVPPDKDHQ